MSAKPAPRLWTEAEIETLRAGWRVGLTCREIAATLPHRNRLSVAGMAHRLGLPVRGPGMVARSKPRTQTPRRPTATSRGLIVRDYVPAPISLAGPAWSHPGRAA